MLDPRLASSWPLVVLLGAMTTGCYTTTLIPPDEVLRLAVNGSMAGEPLTVHDVNDAVVSIGDKYSVKIDPRPDLPPAWAQWSAAAPAIKSPFVAEVRGPMLLLESERDPQVTQVPLAYVKQIRVREYSHGKTAALSIGLTLGGVVLFVGVGLLIAATARPGIE